MNPAKALSALVTPPPTPLTTSSETEVARAWLKLFQLESELRSLNLSTGIRPLLKEIFRILAGKGYEAWLPQDVYPVYGELAKEGDLPFRTFPTYPTLSWEFLGKTGGKSALLIPSPLTPAGRYLKAQEADILGDWLLEDPERKLILDTAYHFETPFDPATFSLLQKGAFLLYSMTKAWLSPDTLGVAVTSDEFSKVLSPLLPTPPSASLSIARFRWENSVHLPSMLQEIFKKRWAALENRIRKASPGWSPPKTGYFSTISRPAATLLEEHGLLAVPASVFGATEPNESIVTCLHEGVGA
ncbi:MAG: hypothetical protein U1F57_01865 [bacterium]